MSKYKLIAIAAVSVDGIIGVDSKIPWHISEDFKHFRNTTMGNILVIGFNTYLTLPEKAFEGREYFVLNGGNFFKTNRENIKQFVSVENLLEHLNYHHKLFENKKIFVAGGAMVYNSMIELCDEAIITWVNKDIPDGNKTFPIDKLITNFAVTEDQEYVTSASGESYKITRYINRNLGIQKELQIIIAGRPNSGKSTFMFNLQRLLMQNGYSVQLSLEGGDYSNLDEFYADMERNSVERYVAVKRNTKITLKEMQMARVHKINNPEITQSKKD